jgi:hypothetical protein
MLFKRFIKIIFNYMIVSKCLCCAMLVFLFLVTPAVLADPPGPPGPGGNPASGGSAPVGAPVDDGILVLLVLGTAYGGYKIYKNQLSRQE